LQLFAELREALRIIEFGNRTGLQFAQPPIGDAADCKLAVVVQDVKLAPFKRSSQLLKNLGGMFALGHIGSCCPALQDRGNCDMRRAAQALQGLQDPMTAPAVRIEAGCAVREIHTELEEGRQRRGWRPMQQLDGREEIRQQLMDL
jgi:hypothetical protein